MTATLMACTLLIAACNKTPASTPASQVVAKVNKQEITVHQVNYLLEQQRGLKPAQAEAARKQALERLVDQELALQKAAEIKIDRDARVMQQIEAARRDIIAKAYFERVGDGATKPSETQIHKYYTDNPELFSERRVYQLQEWLVDLPADQAGTVRAKAQSSKTMAEFTDYLKANNLKFEFNQAVRAAEQLPLGSLASFAKLRDGDTVVNERPNGLQVILLVSSRREPVELARVRPAVEQFLLNEQKSKIIADDLKALRMAAAIRYVDDTKAQPAPAQQPSSATSGAGAAQADAVLKTAMGPK